MSDRFQITIQVDLESNCKYGDRTYVVQVKNSAEGWVDSKHGGHTISSAIDSAKSLWHNASSWISENRTPMRIVRNRTTPHPQF